MDFNSLNDIIVNSLSHTNKVRYALYSAKLVFKIFEDKHPNDKRSRVCIEAVEEWLRDPSEVNREKCRDATADAAAYNAAYTAAYAAYAYAAGSSAYYAAAAANAAYRADNSIGNLILRYGVELIIEEGREVSEELRGIEMDIRLEEMMG